MDDSLLLLLRVLFMADVACAVLWFGWFVVLEEFIRRRRPESRLVGAANRIAFLTLFGVVCVNDFWVRPFFADLYTELGVSVAALTRFLLYRVPAGAMPIGFVVLWLMYVAAVRRTPAAHRATLDATSKVAGLAYLVVVPAVMYGPFFSRIETGVTGGMSDAIRLLA
jgi:hypothetical protein